jgi:hypothetical protein
VAAAPVEVDTPAGEATPDPASAVATAASAAATAASAATDLALGAAASRAPTANRHLEFAHRSETRCN